MGTFSKKSPDKKMAKHYQEEYFNLKFFALTKIKHVCEFCQLFRDHEETITGSRFVYADRHDLDLFNTLCFLWIDYKERRHTPSQKVSILKVTSTELITML